MKRAILDEQELVAIPIDRVAPGFVGIQAPVPLALPRIAPRVLLRCHVQVVKHPNDALGYHSPVEIGPFAVIESKPRAISIRPGNIKNTGLACNASAVLPLNSGEARDLPGCKSPSDQRPFRYRILNDCPRLPLKRNSLCESEFSRPPKRGVTGQCNPVAISSSSVKNELNVRYAAIRVPCNCVSLSYE